MLWTEGVEVVGGRKGEREFCPLQLADWVVLVAEVVVLLALNERIVCTVCLVPEL